MGIWSVLFMSTMPVFRLLVHCGIGAYLSSPKSNVMPGDARKHINKLVFVCFMPSLVFSNLAQTVTVEKMIDWWFMPINVLLCYVIGAGIGICIYDHFKPPPHLKRLIIACCATGNSSNLPLVLVSAICVEAGSPFGRFDVCTANGVAYVSYGLWMSTVLTWTVVFNYLKPAPQPGYEQIDLQELPQDDRTSYDRGHIYEDDEASLSSAHEPEAMTPAKGFSGFQGPQAFQGSQGPQRFQGPPGPQGFQGPQCLQSQGSQGFSPGYQVSQNFQGTQGSYQGSQGLVGPQRAPGYQASEDFQGYQGSQGFQAPQGFQGSQEFEGPQGYQSFQGPQEFQGPGGPQGFSVPRGFQGSEGFPGVSQGTRGPQGFQAPRGFQGPQGFQGPRGQGAQGFQGPQRIQEFQEFQGPQRAQEFQEFQGPQGFQSPQVYQGYQGQVFPAPQEFQLPQIPGPQGFPGRDLSQGPQGFQVPQVRQGEGFQGPQGRSPSPGPQGFQAPQIPQGQGFQGPQGFAVPQVPQVPQVSQAPQALQVFQGPQPTGTQAAALPARREFTDELSLANLQLLAEKLRLKEAFTPPTTAAAIAIPVGAVPFFRHLLYGHEAPFRFFGDALTILGEAMIPCMNLLLGGNLSQGFGASELALEVVISIMLTRLLLLPIAGLIVVKLAFAMGLVPADPLFHFVLLLQFTMPTAINVGTMTQLFGVGQTECSIILFWCYTSSVVFLTLWTMIFLVLLI